MRGGSAAKRYARALLIVAQGQNQVDVVDQDLQKLSIELKAHQELRQVLESPVVKPSVKQTVFEKVAERLKLAPSLINLVRVLIDRDRMEVLVLLARIYQDLADESLGRVRVQVKSAGPLEEQEAQLKALLEKSLGKQVLMETQVDSSLLGGFTIQVNDRVFDASLKHELERIKEEVIQKAIA